MEQIKDLYKIRKVAPGDVDALAAVEAECFPAAEAASWESLKARSLDTRIWECPSLCIGALSGMI